MKFNEKICPICGSKTELTQPIESEFYGYKVETCNACGSFFKHDDYAIHDTDIDLDKIASYLYYNCKMKDRICYLGEQERNDGYYHVTHAMVDNWYPRTFSDRITKILLGLAQQSSYLGKIVEQTREELISAWFIKRYDKKGEKLDEKYVSHQIEEICNYLVDNKYVESTSSSNGWYHIIKPEGWKRIDDLLINDSNNHDVFVSMSFRKKTDKTREAIRRGIIDAGYSAEFIDEIKHNKQIVPEMFRLIRDCRFLILEISDPNYGAYYEAGYALGLGKEVIITCKNEIFSKEYITDEEKKYARYLKPHFDISQKQILLWDNYADLTKKLTEWIKAIIG